MDLVGAIAQIENIITVLSLWLNDPQMFETVLDDAKSDFLPFLTSSLNYQLYFEDYARMAGSEITLPRHGGRSKAAQDQNADTFYKNSLFNPFVQSVIDDLKIRFNNHQKIVTDLVRLLPQNLGENTC